MEEKIEYCHGLYSTKKDRFELYCSPKKESKQFNLVSLKSKVFIDWLKDKKAIGKKMEITFKII